MNQTTFSFPQMVNRTVRKIQMSTQNQSINECLGILLRTRPGELLGDPNYGCNVIDRVYRYHRSNSRRINKRRYFKCC